jgi:FAD/FMN-containing dehydrogenase
VLRLPTSSVYSRHGRDYAHTSRAVNYFVDAREKCTGSPICIIVIRERVDQLAGSLGGQEMKWKSIRQRQNELRVHGWQQSLTSLDARLTEKAVTAVSDLQLKIQGTIVLPVDAEYHRRRQLANFAFQDFPQFIAYCEVFSDVRECLQFARARKLPVVIRSGGHSTAGFSINSGMVIDVSRLIYVVVDTGKKQASVGAGTRFGHLNNALDIYNLHVPGGGCHDVCVAGFMQGGGYGYTSREFGMNCDNVVDATVMLADGSIVIASEKTNPDLFWALRGGTGGNFGIVLQVTYQLHALGNLNGFRIWWSVATPDGIAHAAWVLAQLQAGQMRRGGTKKLGYMAFVGSQEETPCLLVRGMYDGAVDELKRILDPLKKVAPLGEIYEVGSYRRIDKFIHEGPEVPQVPDLAREDKQSGYIDRQLTGDSWQEVIRRFLATPNRYSLLAIEPYGGAISEKPADASAFIHRTVDMNFYVDVFWMSDEEKGPAVKFLDEFMAFMEAKHFNGQSYQNYPRAVQTDYRRRYWGASFATLRATKRKYDPEDFFQYAQGVLPDQQHPDPPDSSQLLAQVRPWLDAPIEYQVR